MSNETKEGKKCEHGKDPKKCYPCYAHRREQENDISISSCRFSWFHTCGNHCPGQEL